MSKQIFSLISETFRQVYFCICEFLKMETVKIASDLELSSVYQEHRSLHELTETELHDEVKEMKLQLERTRMENVWMENFLRINAPSLLRDVNKSVINKKRRTFSMRKQSSLSILFTRIYHDPFALTKIVDSLKFELCEKQLLQIEDEMKKMRNRYDDDMRALTADKQEAEISSKEFSNAIAEFKSFVIERGFDKKANKVSTQVFIKFIEDIIRNGETMAESIRMKADTLKRDCGKQKGLVMKRKEMSSCLRPVDFELSTIEKRKFQKINEETQSHHQGLQDDARLAFLKKNKEQKQLYKAKLQHQKIEAKSSYSESLVEKIKLEKIKSEADIEKLEKSVGDLKKMSKEYEAPSIFEYIQMIQERDALKHHLKIAKRKTEISKVRLNIAKQKYRAQVLINKNNS